MLRRNKIFVFSVLLFGILWSNTWAAHWYPLPDTGQKRCFDTEGNEMVPCPAEGELLYGQDAQYSSSEQSFRDNVDGTVTDLNTGLIWQKSSSAIISWTSANNDYCQSVQLPGTGWRLPEIFELSSIIDLGGSGFPAINPVFQYTYNDDTDFSTWSATEFPSLEDSSPYSQQVWIVRFNFGIVEPSYKYYYIAAATYEEAIYGVRCVREP